MSKRASTVLDLAARWRSIAINGTRPEPSATSSSGPPSSMRQVNGAADGTARLQIVCDAKHPRQVRRNLPVIDPLHRQRHLRALRRRRDRIRALGLVAVLCGEPNVDVLAGNMPRPPRHVQHDGLGPRCLLDEAADGCDLPPSRYSSHTWLRQEWPRAMLGWG